MSLHDLLAKVAVAVRNETVSRGGELPDVDMFAFLDKIMPDDADMFVLKDSTVAGLVRALSSISGCDDLEASALAEDALENYRSSLEVIVSPVIH